MRFPGATRDSVMETTRITWESVELKKYLYKLESEIEKKILRFGVDVGIDILSPIFR